MAPSFHGYSVSVTSAGPPTTSTREPVSRNELTQSEPGEGRDRLPKEFRASGLPRGGRPSLDRVNLFPGLHARFAMTRLRQPFYAEARSPARNLSFQPARLNLLRRETLDRSFCIKFSAMWCRIAKLYALLSLRLLA